MREGMYLESADVVAISNRNSVTTVTLYQYKPTIVSKAVLTVTDNTSFPGNKFLSFSEIVSSKYILVLGLQSIVDIWDVSNINSVVHVKAYYLDNVDPNTKWYDYVYSFKQSSEFLVALTKTPNFSMQRYDFNIATPGLISVNKEFENINGAGAEFMHTLRRIDRDEHDDIIMAYTKDSTPTPPLFRLYTYQRQCSYLTQNGNHPVCYDCFSDQKITLSSLSNCMLVSTIRFFTYKVTQNLVKTDDEKNFNGVITLENFDINTNIIPTL